MPFTPSHALVALPFVRTPLVPGAIAVGAMTPDLPLFVRGTILGYGFTHTYANVLWTAFAAFVLFLVWRIVLRPAVPELSPRWLALRLPEDWRSGGMPALRAAVTGGSRLYPLMLAVSLVLGVLSHILWDSFTHEDRWGVTAVPALEEPWGPFLGYKWLQYGSGVIGLAVIVIWAIVRVLRATPASRAEQTLPAGVRIAWWLSLPSILLTAWLLGLAAYGPLTDEFTVAHLGYRMLPPACALWGALTLVLCLSLPLFRRGHQRG